MILIDTALQARAAEGRPVKVALIGAGTMGRAMAMQIVQATPGLKLVAAANRTGKNARQAWLEAGIPDPAEVGRLGALNDAIARGVPAITEDALLLCEAEGIDVLIEATGAVEFGARCAMKAFACRKDFATMSGDFDGHIDELCHNGRYDLDLLRALGGVVDYVVKARPRLGVFVFATHDDPRQRRLLEHYKLGPGPLCSFYVPSHLCHFEALRSAARAALFRDATLAAQRPMVDTITLAKVDLRAGQVLDAIGGFLTRGECENHRIYRAENLFPHGLAEGCRLIRPVPRDTAITRADVVVPEGRLCDALRAEQDAMFGR